jgi:hypothetical protein
MLFRMGTTLARVKANHTRAFYASTLNRDGALPSVSLEMIPPQTNGTLVPTTFRIRNDQDVQVGSCVLNIAYAPGSGGTKMVSAYLNTISIYKGHLGRNYGRAAYVEILGFLGDVPLQSGFQLSRGSKPAWDWLVDHGVAEQISPGFTDERRINAAYSSTEYRTL